ncbi:type I-E CRISPR-associated protein Cse2/CasB [Nocardiopsis lucentensis]|uniref:type I-E CRISPR-associated protein Cse2/CasB n=1 Tax=Nocardiopsis lucentensis TaxID=53441 RepID=UPI000344D829|nr:type I-E CRISPR-associated protein Cse2/CasB [Nocardiopsis lucentensis]
MTQTDQTERTQQVAGAQHPETENKGRSDLGPVGNAVNDRVEDLLEGYLADRSDAVAALAQLRGGAGKTFGECPQLWGLTVDAHQYTHPGWNRRQQDWAEEAVHAAITLFALHQQSLRGTSSGNDGQDPSEKDHQDTDRPARRGRHDNRMHRRAGYLDGDRGRLPHHGLGWAVRACMPDGRIDPALHNRLKKAAQASALRTRVGELRQIVARLRQERIPLDYGLLADQLFRAQEPGGIKQVRDEWGHGFVSYRPPRNNDSAAEATSDDATTTPEKEHQ